MEIIFATCGCHAATNLIPDAVAHSLIAFCLSIYIVVVVVRGQQKNELVLNATHKAIKCCKIVQLTPINRT